MSEALKIGASQVEYVRGLEAQVAGLRALILRLDWCNIHTHYGYTTTCDDCALFADLLAERGEDENEPPPDYAGMERAKQERYVTAFGLTTADLAALAEREAGEGTA